MTYSCDESSRVKLQPRPAAMKNEFFERHFRHRITLLETFRERFGNPDAPGALDWRTCGDLYRCAMDISMAMVRYFCEEMGIKNSHRGSDRLEEQEAA
jgi:hypothetical protein